MRGKNIRKRFVSEIKVSPLPCRPVCSCPSLSIVSSPKIIKEGKNAVFTAQVAGGSQNSVTYKWTVSEGEIFKGQGTSKIKVKTNGLAEKILTATVEVNGDLCAECFRYVNSVVEIY